MAESTENNMTDSLNLITNTGRPDLNASTKSKSARPFKQAMQSYVNNFLEPAIANAIIELDDVENVSRYARVKIPLFSTIEVDVENNGTLKPYSYAIHKLHYGPIDKNMINKIQYPEDMSADQIRANNFCFRDPSIWVEVNSEGKNPGGNGMGFGNTACSVFRDRQIMLRDKNYYLIDLSQYVYDNDNKKWYYRIDIRLYSKAEAVDVNPNLWHQYGVIPGMGRLSNTQDQTTQPTNPPVPSDHGEFDVEKKPPSE